MYMLRHIYICAPESQNDLLAISNISQQIFVLVLPVVLSPRNAPISYA